MNWEIKAVFIGTKEMASLEAVLNSYGKKGWEPYGIDSNYHYFKKQVGEHEEAAELKANKKKK